MCCKPSSILFATKGSYGLMTSPYTCNSFFNFKYNRSALYNISCTALFILAYIRVLPLLLHHNNHLTYMSSSLPFHGSTFIIPTPLTAGVAIYCWFACLVLFLGGELITSYLGMAYLSFFFGFARLKTILMGSLWALTRITKRSLLDAYPRRWNHNTHDITRSRRRGCTFS